MRRYLPVILIPVLGIAGLVTGMVVAKPGDPGQIAGEAEAPAFRSPDGTAVLRLLLEPDEPGTAYLGRGTFRPGAQAPHHRHGTSEEILYVLSGRGTMSLGERQVEVREGMAVRIPAGVEHSFRITGDQPMEIVQFYSPAGPEQRFRKWDREAQDADAGGRR